MRNLLFVAALLTFAVVLSAQSPTMQAPWPPLRKEVPHTTDKVRDVLFPRTFHTRFFIVLRFLHSDAPEPQIVISSADEQTYDVVLAVPDTNIHHEVGRIVRETGVRDEMRIAKQITVKVQKVQVPRHVLDTWLTSLQDLKFVTKDHGLVVVDGTVHELWFQTSNGERAYFSYNDPFENDENKGHPVVRWMNKVEADVKKYANSGT